MSLKSIICEHSGLLSEVLQPANYSCEECVKTGSSWVHLRTCQTCGTTLCCDSSPNKHATKHFHRAGHPVVASAEPGERWLWCYADQVFLPY